VSGSDTTVFAPQLTPSGLRVISCCCTNSIRVVCCAGSYPAPTQTLRCLSWALAN